VRGYVIRSDVGRHLVMAASGNRTCAVHSGSHHRQLVSVEHGCSKPQGRRWQWGQM